MKLFLRAVILLIPLCSFAEAQDSDEALARCRSIGLESFIQQLVGQNVAVTSTILAFCDDYKQLFDRTVDVEEKLTNAAQALNQTIQSAEVLKAQVSALQTKTKSLRDRLPPEDSIIIVDDADGCPTGWKDVAASEPKIFAGRMIIARGFHSDRVPREYRAFGGEERVLLSESEMPMHNHVVSTSHHNTDQHDGLAGSGSTAVGLDPTYDPTPDTGGHGPVRNMLSFSGDDRAHNNMPPYVALYYCKQDPYSRWMNNER